MIDVVDKIILPISDISTLTIETDCPAKELTPYCDINIVLQDKGKQYVLYGNDCIAGTIWGLASFFEAVLNNVLELDQSINQDIGYLWNEIVQYEYDESFPTSELKRYEFIRRYKLWDAWYKNGQELITWIFTQNNKIMLEVTPLYVWQSSDENNYKNDKDYLTYDEFIKSYKPELIIELPREIVQQWVIKFKELVTLIQENHEKKMKEIEEAKKVENKVKNAKGSKKINKKRVS